MYVASFRCYVYYVRVNYPNETVDIDILCVRFDALFASRITRNPAYVEQCLAIIAEAFTSRFAVIGRPFADGICIGERRWRVI